MDTRLQLPSPNRDTLGAFAAEQLAIRLRRLAYELRHVRHSMSEERVHDLRVALRRLMEAVRALRGILPKDGAEEVLDDLRRTMNAAGEVRGCDIAIQLLQHAGAPEDSDALRQLREGRRQAEQRLYERAHNGFQRNSTAKWRASLLPMVSGRQ